MRNLRSPDSAPVGAVSGQKKPGQRRQRRQCLQTPLRDPLAVACPGFNADVAQQAEQLCRKQQVVRSRLTISTTFMYAKMRTAFCASRRLVVTPCKISQKADHRHGQLAGEAFTGEIRWL